MAANIHGGVFLLLSLAACLTTATSISAPADIEQKVVFKMGEGGNYCFRIPALVFTVNGTLLAFAEGRGRQTKTCLDHGPDVHIVLKRSTDFGDTWSDLFTIYEEPGHTIGEVQINEWVGLISYLAHAVLVYIYDEPCNCIKLPCHYMHV